MYEATVCILQAVAFFLQKDVYTDGGLLPNIRCQTEIYVLPVVLHCQKARS